MEMKRGNSGDEGNNGGLDLNEAPVVAEMKENFRLYLRKGKVVILYKSGKILKN